MHGLWRSCTAKGKPMKGTVARRSASILSALVLVLVLVPGTGVTAAVDEAAVAAATTAANQACRGDDEDRVGGGFSVLVVESGTGLPGRCNNNTDPVWGGKLSASNPFTPDLLVLNRAGQLTRGPLFKPTSTTPATNTGYQPDGPA